MDTIFEHFTFTSKDKLGEWYLPTLANIKGQDPFPFQRCYHLPTFLPPAQLCENDIAIQAFNRNMK